MLERNVTSLYLLAAFFLAMILRLLILTSVAYSSAVDHLTLEERHFVIRAIRENWREPAPSIFARLRNEVSVTSAPYDRVRSYHDSIIAATIVPSWFHDALAAIRPEEELSDPAVFAAIRSAVSQNFKGKGNDELFAYIGTLWREFCIFPSTAFPAKTFCSPTQNGKWKLSPSQLIVYLDYLYIHEERRFKPLSSLPAEDLNSDVIGVYEEWRTL